MFLEKLLPLHPPIFGDWFRIMFPDSYGWYVLVKYILHMLFCNSVYMYKYQFVKLTFEKGMKLARHILEQLLSCLW